MSDGDGVVESGGTDDTDEDNGVDVGCGGLLTGSGDVLGVLESVPLLAVLLSLLVGAGTKVEVGVEDGDVVGGGLLEGTDDGDGDELLEGVDDEGGGELFGGDDEVG